MGPVGAAPRFALTIGRSVGQIAPSLNPGDGSEIRTKMLAMSAATIDRTLAPVREGLGRHRRRPAPHALRSRITIRTSADRGNGAAFSNIYGEAMRYPE
jgi:hypothetical protein